MFVGGAIGAAMVLVMVAVLFIAPPESLKPDIKDNSADIVADTTPSNYKSLSLIEIFEKSEAGVVRVNVQRGETEDVTGGLGSGLFLIKKVTSYQMPTL